MFISLPFTSRLYNSIDQNTIYQTILITFQHSIQPVGSGAFVFVSALVCEMKCVCSCHGMIKMLDIEFVKSLQVRFFERELYCGKPDISFVFSIDRVQSSIQLFCFPMVFCSTYPARAYTHTHTRVGRYLCCCCWHFSYSFNH